MLVYPALLLPLAQNFAISLEEVLALSFWMYLLFGVSALAWGMLADRFGPRPLLAIFHGGAGLCGIWIALSLDSPLGLWLPLAGLGLFSGIYHPVGLGWIAKEMKKTSRSMALNGMFGNLGLAVAPLVAGSVNYFFGLSAVYLVLGLLNFTGLILLFFTKKSKVVRRSPSQVGANVPGGNLRVFLLLLIAMTLGGIIYRASSVSLPAYLELRTAGIYQIVSAFVDFGSANVMATMVTSLIFIMGMLGQFVGGRVGERYDLRKGYLFFHIMTIPAALAMAQFYDGVLIIFAMIHVFFLLGMQPMENTLVARLAPPKVLSSAYGLKFILTFGVGSLSVKMVEIVKISWGFVAVFQVLAMVSLLLVATILLLMSKSNHQN